MCFSCFIMGLFILLRLRECRSGLGSFVHRLLQRDAATRTVLELFTILYNVSIGQLGMLAVLQASVVQLPVVTFGVSTQIRMQTLAVMTLQSVQEGEEEEEEYQVESF